MKKINTYLIILAFSLFLSCEITDYSIENYSFINNKNSISSIEQIKNFAIKAQAKLGGYNVEQMAEVIEHSSFDNLPDFLHSKPTVDSNSLKIYSYLPTLKERNLEYEQVWFKLKTPDAIDNSLSIDKIGSAEKSDKILELAFEEARKLVPIAAAIVDAKGYTFSFTSKNYIAGSLWSSTNITLELRGNKNIFISSPTLISSKIFPVIGGMNYCKVFTPENAARILIDLSRGDHDKIPFENPDNADLNIAAGPMHSSRMIHWSGIFSKFFTQKALLFVDKKYEISGNFKGTYIICPDGYIPAISMRGLAKSIAAKGYIVFVIKYFDDNAVWEIMQPRQNSDINLANLIRNKNIEQIKGLTEKIKRFYRKSSTPIIAFGHSQGGAALGYSIFGQNNPYEQIIASGALIFMKPKSKGENLAENVALILGTNESKNNQAINKILVELSINTVADPDGIFRSNEGNRTFGFVEDLNHFGIISDMNSGISALREDDGEGPPPSVAVKIMTDYLEQRGLL